MKIKAVFNKLKINRYFALYQNAINHNYKSEGIEDIKQIMTLIPQTYNHQKSQLLLSSCYRDIGLAKLDQYKYASKCFLKAIQFNNKNSKAVENLAMIEMNVDPETSIGHAQMAIGLGDNSAMCYEILGMDYMKLSDYKDALTYLNQSLKIKRSSEVYMLLGKIQASIGRYTQSAHFYKLAIKYDSRNSDNYEILGDLYYHQMKLPHLAVKYYKQAINLDSHKSSYYINLENVEVNLGNTSKCIKLLEKALLYNSNNDMIYDRLGKLYLDRGGQKNAKRSLPYFNRAIHLSINDKIDQGDQDYYYNKGHADLILGNYGDCVYDIMMGANFTSDKHFIGYGANLCNAKGLEYGSDDPYNAKLCYTSALKLKKKAPFFYNLALADQDLHDDKDALKAAKKSLKLNNTYKPCRDLIKDLRPHFRNSIKETTYNPKVNYMNKLNRLIGLDLVKHQVKQYVNNAIIHKIRTGHHGHGEIHLVLEGNPGTGKTTVAKLLCGILYQKHVINKKKFISVNSTQLVGWRSGEGAKNIRELIQKAKGGVLFIDEAYHLRHRTDGNSAVQDEITAEMLPDIEKYRNDLVVIMAGYAHAMEKFLKHSNPGLGSRFPDRIKFPDYTNHECTQIMGLYLNENHYHLSSKSTKELLNKDLISYISANRSNTDHIFANARTIRNIFSKLNEAFSDRLTAKYTLKQLNEYKKQGAKLLNTITITDVKNTFKEYNLNRNNSNAFQQLNNMIGLTNVKHLIKSFVNQVTVHKIRTGKAIHDDMNMVFEGKPGTGKTTVAKLFCRILYQRGITKSPKYVYVSATHLNGRFIGQGAYNVRKAFHKAKNGVLFIDEAYALGNRGGKDTVDQLISDVSKYQNKIVIILAGYQKSMERFLNGSNAGLSSRFPIRVKFNDYNNKECLEILKYDLNNNGLLFGSSKAKHLLAIDFISYISAMRQKNGRHFANARTVNNFFKSLCHSFDDRIGSHSVKKLQAWKQAKSRRLNTITLADVKAANRKMIRLSKLTGADSDYDGTAIGFKAPAKQDLSKFINV